MVVVRRFVGGEPSFGHHGETTSTTDLALFDRVDNTETADNTETSIHEIVDLDASARFLLITDERKLWLALHGQG